MISSDRKMQHMPSRRVTTLQALAPVEKESEQPRWGLVGVRNLWGASPAYPHLSAVGDVPRWLDNLYEVSASSTPRSASAIVLWTIDTALHERGGLELLDRVLADVDAERITSGAIVALVRGTHHTGERLPSRRGFLLRARTRLLALGKDPLVSGNSDLACLGPDGHAAGS